jgi:hypothetical protein
VISTEVHTYDTSKNKSQPKPLLGSLTQARLLIHMLRQLTWILPAGTGDEEGKIGKLQHQPSTPTAPVAAVQHCGELKSWGKSSQPPQSPTNWVKNQVGINWLVDLLLGR